MSSERRIAVAFRIDEPFPHHQDVLSGVLDYARSQPTWRCVVDEYPSYARPISGKPAQPYDGVIARANPALQRRLERLGIPLVNTWYEHARPTVPGVYPDTDAVGALAATHLLDRGFRRLAFVGTRTYRRDGDIGRAFAKTATEHGATCSTHDCGHPDFARRGDWLALRRRVEEILQALPRPVGVLVSEASVARLFMTVGHELEQSDARNVGVVSLENVKTVVELSPQITSIDGNFFGIGHAAAQLLDLLMSGPKPRNVMLTIPPRAVVSRESTDYFAVEDDTVAAALRYISSRLSKPLALAEIARAVATSPRSLQRRFEAALGCAVTVEIRRLRVALAKRLIADSKRSLDQIAREAGFSSAAVMNQVFQRDAGMSSSAYRKQVQGERTLA